MQTRSRRLLPCFVHINKNGGSTIRGVLRNTYGDNLHEVLIQGRRGLGGLPKNADSDDEDVRAAIADVRAREDAVDCIAANIPFGLHRHLRRTLGYFSLLREPVERCISFWYFAHSSREYGGVWRTFEEFDFDVAQIIDSKRVFQLWNDQTRFITGSIAAEVDEDDLALAIELIQHEYVFVGTVEAFDASLAHLARSFGWPVQNYERLNVGDRTDGSVLPHDAARVFKEANDLDRRLHEWVQATYLPKRLAA